MHKDIWNYKSHLINYSFPLQPFQQQTAKYAEIRELYKPF